LGCERKENQQDLPLGYSLCSNSLITLSCMISSTCSS
jgi:hypothetical protein